MLMKAHIRLVRSWFPILSFLALSGAAAVMAQDPNATVTIHATDPQAAEAWSDTGAFTIRRNGGTNFHQLIFYELSGTASNGLDYEQIGGTVEMPAGALAVSVTVKPINDSLVEGTETVLARIVPSPLQCPTCGYEIGQPDIAEVRIEDNDTGGTNHPPFIRLNSPVDGAEFTGPADIGLRAYAQDTEDRFFVRVEFFEGANSLGFGTFEPTACPAPYCPYFALTWSDVPPGEYTITARVTESGGLTSVSDPARITVLDPERPRSGLYAIDSGRYTACCGFAGNDLGYDLPTQAQIFVRLELDSLNNTASMAFLGEDAQTVFRVAPCGPEQPTYFSFTHGQVFSNRLVFHADPGPRSYWNYTVTYSAHSLRIDGGLRITQPFCADVPDKFGHTNVVATLLPRPPRIEGLERQGSNLRFHFTGEPPYDYFVEYTDVLHRPNWLSLTNFRAKVATIQALVSDPMTNGATRFYRVWKQHCLCRTPTRPAP